MIARLCRLSLVAAVLVAVTALGAPAAQGASYKKCGLTEREGQPPSGVPTYNLTLRQKGTSCKTAKRVVKAFHSCRKRTSYTCSKRLLSHWRCTGRRTSKIDTTFYANVTCSWGKRRVRNTYQQNTD